jgi:hypothetical protein
MDGIIEDLDRLHDEGRRRFVKRCSREELEDIVVAAWRMRDEAKAHPNGRLYLSQHSSETNIDVEIRNPIVKVSVNHPITTQMALFETVRPSTDLKIVNPLTK